VEQSREWKSLQSQSHIAYDTGKKTLALLLFKQLLQLSPKNPRVLTDLGNVENELYNFTGALHYFRQALVIAPKHIGALLGVGDSLGQLGNHLQAIEYYKQAVSAPIPSDYLRKHLSSKTLTRCFRI
jgi:tetratricopeptide (TPR) repeat protein